MNARTNLWKACALTLVFALAFTVVAMRESSWALAHDNDADGHGQQIDLWLPSAGIVYGETLRTTLTNFGARAVTVRPTLVDADGVVVKQAAESLVLEPGQMRSFEVSRSEMGGGPALTSNNGQGVTLRPAMSMRRQDAKKMLVTVEVVDEATGSTRFQSAGTCPPWMCGADGNHNETLVRDAAPVK